MPDPCHSSASPLAVIFDLDDTLVHGWDRERRAPVDVHYLSWRAVLAERGIHLPRERYLADMKGLDNAGCDAYLERALGLGRGERLAARKEVCYRERVAPRYLRLRPGVAACLERLAAAGVRLGILTNAPRRNLEVTYQVVGLERWIAEEDALAADDLARHGLAPKPDGAGLLWLGRRLGASRERLRYVGDSRIDVRAGRAAGVAVVALTVNYPAAELRALGAAVTIDELADLDIELLACAGAG